MELQGRWQFSVPSSQDTESKQPSERGTFTYKMKLSKVPSSHVSKHRLSDLYFPVLEARRLFLKLLCIQLKYMCLGWSVVCVHCGLIFCLGTVHELRDIAT